MPSFLLPDSESGGNSYFVSVELTTTERQHYGVYDRPVGLSIIGKQYTVVPMLLE